MTLTLSYAGLLKIEQELAQLEKTNPAITMLLLNKIDRFRQVSSMHSKTMHGRMNEIKHRYIQEDSEGNLLAIGDGQHQVYKFKEHVTDIANAVALVGKAVEEKYLQDMNKFLARQFTIEL